mmetsp:Transcript_2483/g.5179  ORF Transcript_2483/g.5179 Transcript_2483/m.5179 type:complete len:291 (-) Transcript_2483:1266-2138(-)
MHSAMTQSLTPFSNLPCPGKVPLLSLPSLSHVLTLSSLHLLRRTSTSKPQALCPTITSGSHAPTCAMNLDIIALSLGLVLSCGMVERIDASRSWGKVFMHPSAAASPRGRTSESCCIDEALLTPPPSMSPSLLHTAQRLTISDLCDLGLTTVFILSVIVTTGGAGASSPRLMFFGFWTFTSILQWLRLAVEGVKPLMSIQQGPMRPLLMMKVSRVGTFPPNILSMCSPPFVHTSWEIAGKVAGYLTLRYSVSSLGTPSTSNAYFLLTGFPAQLAPDCFGNILLTSFFISP